ncbi:hypothetical protein KKA15_02790 [Patescibacteria group bacterium]|nr:hypothetical protein [Patescibacteria group bacterium]
MLPDEFSDKILQLIKSNYPDLEEDDFDEVNRQFRELSEFLVRQYIRQHPRAVNLLNLHEKPQDPRKSSEIKIR